MKHSTYSLVNRINISRPQLFIKRLLNSNIKTTWTNTKSIWYSMRFNAGENFIMNEKLLYPYTYDHQISESQKSEPVRLSTKLLTACTDKHYMSYVNSKTPGQIPQKLVDENNIQKNFNEAFNELYKMYQYAEDNKCDCPAVVSARLIYACAIRKIEDHSILTNVLAQFISKVEFADAESIGQVMLAMSKYGYYKPTIWEPLIAELQKKSFLPEFTSLSFAGAHVNRFREVSHHKLMDIDEFGNQLFSEGYLHAFEAYVALKAASENGIKAGQLIGELEMKMPMLKSKCGDYAML